MKTATDPSSMGALMEELIRYHGVSLEFGWTDEAIRVQEKMKSLVLSQLLVPLKVNPVEFSVEKYDRVWEDVGALTQEYCSPFDWNVIIASLLLLSHERPFVESFGPEKFRLEQLYQFYSSTYSANPSKGRASSCSISVLGGTVNGSCEFRPQDWESHDRLCHLEMPRSLSDPKHWGHVVWLYCNAGSSFV